MKLDYLILADAAQTTPDGKVYIIGGDIDTINAPAFPAIHPMISLVAKLRFETSDEINNPHEIRVDFTNPEGLNITPGNTLLLNPRQIFDKPELPGKFSFVLNFPALVLQTPGSYTLRLFTDDEELGSLPLLVKQSSAEQTTPQE